MKLSRLEARLHPGDELAVHLVNRRTISRLNREFLGRRGATDVITFDYREGDLPPAAGARTAGEIFVCPEVAAQKTAEFRLTLGEEVVLYVIHGILHLAGRNDRRGPEIAAMRQAEREILDRLRREFTLADLFVGDGRES